MPPPLIKELLHERRGSPCLLLVTIMGSHYHGLLPSWPSPRPIRTCLRNEGFKWMEKDWRDFGKFWLIVEIPPPQCTSFPFIPTSSKQALRESKQALRESAPQVTGVSPATPRLDVPLVSPAPCAAGGRGGRTASCQLASLAAALRVTPSVANLLRAKDGSTRCLPVKSGDI
jgi:hypothetical protein